MSAPDHQQSVEQQRSLVSALGATLSAQSAGTSRQYSLLVAQLRFGADATLLRLLTALARCVSVLGATTAVFEELLVVALDLRFRPVTAADVSRFAEAQGAIARAATGADGGGAGGKPAAMCTLATAEAHAAFCVALVAANPLLLARVVRALARSLNAAAEESEAYAPHAAAAAAPEIARTLARFFRTVYASIAEILTIVPTAAPTVAALLLEVAPHARHSVAAHVAFARHALALASRVPALRDRMVASLVERVVELDVSVPLELLPDEDADIASGSAQQPLSPAAAAAAESIEKVDALLRLLFRWVHAQMCGCGLHARVRAALAATTESALKHSMTRTQRPSEADSEDSSRSRRASRSEADAGDGDDATTDASDVESVGEESMPPAALALRIAASGAMGNIGGVPIWPDAILDSVAPDDCERLRELTAPSGGAPPASSSAQSGIALDVLAPTTVSSALSAHGERVFALVLGSWERSVLSAHRTKFAQFFLFYAVSLAPAAVDRFVGRLISHLRNSARPLRTRLAAAGYLGSFLARSAVVDDTTLRSALWYCLEWAHGFLDLHAAHAAHTLRVTRLRGTAAVRALATACGSSADSKDFNWLDDSAQRGTTSSFCSSVDGDDSRADGVAAQPPPIPLHLLVLDSSLPEPPSADLFSAIMQAAFYVICFRGADFRARVGGVESLRSLAWGRLCSSRVFDPLARAPPAVAREFLRVAHTLRLVRSADLAVSSAYASLTGSDELAGDAPATTPCAPPAAASEPALAADDVHGSTLSPASVLPEHADSSGVQAVAVYENFFPFDPLLLRASASVTKNIYRTWTESALHSSALTPGEALFETTDGYDTGATGAGAPPQLRGGVLRPTSGGVGGGGDDDEEDEEEADDDDDNDDDDDDSNDDGSSTTYEEGEGDDDDDLETGGVAETRVGGLTLAPVVAGREVPFARVDEGDEGDSFDERLLSRMRWGMPLENAGASHHALAPNLAAMVDDAKDTEDLLAGLDFDIARSVGASTASGGTSTSVSREAPAPPPRRRGSSATGASSSAVSAPISGSPALRAARNFIVVGFPGDLGPSAPFAGLSAPALLASLEAPAFASPTSRALRSKLRGISVDETAFYTSHAEGARGAARHLSDVGGASHDGDGADSDASAFADGGRDADGVDEADNREGAGRGVKRRRVTSSSLRSALSVSVPDAGRASATAEADAAADGAAKDVAPKRKKRRAAAPDEAPPWDVFQAMMGKAADSLPLTKTEH